MNDPKADWRSAPETKKKKAPDPNALRITMQYRARGGMVYELAAAGHVLALHVKQARDPSSWTIEASSKIGEDSVVATGVGATASQALHEVGVAWRSHCADEGVFDFDWVAVEKALKAVRAL